MKLLRILGICFGVLLMTVVIREVGWASIRETLTLLGWKYAIVLAYSASWMFCNTLGWRYALHPAYATLPLMRMFQIRTAGETFNSLLPSSYVGGEPVKAKLLSAYVPLREAASSVLIAKAAQSVGMLLFIGLGLTLGLPPNAPAGQKHTAWIALAILSGGVLLFTWLLGHNSFSRIGHFLHRFTRVAWLRAQEPRLLALDDSLGTFYREGKLRFLASLLWHGAGWITGMFELWVIFHLMGHPILWRQCWFMGALAQLGSVIGLISPAGLGFYEGGHYMAAVLLGLPPSLGVSASLIRRGREIFWDVVGLYFFGKYSKAAATPAPEPVSTGPGR